MPSRQPKHSAPLRLGHSGAFPAVVLLVLISTLAVVFPPGIDKEEAMAAVRENSETASQSVQKVASASGIVSQNTQELDDNLCKLLDGLRSNRA
ncbi:hypothetical protein HBA54_14595 [Pelagibius litoralis]|uniref:Uncharacterized protein n=1 Tax=Pelagibius litoralis TaxID=374515 RepID=A0A967EYT1_9PROT|nr:hypothetical protein [Pelagibius litoralis]NIA69830.1 hypothetical protein [Pelagibius litoralis]